MTTSAGPAQRWARQQPAEGPVRWKSLEIAAFSPHRKVLRALGPTRDEKRRARQEQNVPWWTVALTPFMLVGALVIFYPAGAYLLLADGRNGRFDVNGLDASVALPLAGGLLLVGGVAHLVAILRRRDTHGADSSMDTVAVLFGALDAVAIAGRGRQDDVPAWPAWCATALLVVAVGVAGFVRRRATRHKPVPVAAGEPRVAVRRRIADLTHDQRDAVRRDIVAAVDELEARGLVNASTAAKGRAAELGMLSIAVSR